MPAVHVSQFRALWAELHRRPFSSQPLNPSTSQREVTWLRHFANRIPCRSCRKHWLEVTEKLPPPFLSTTQPLNRSTYFSWTVRAHNAINARLGKPIMKLQTAKRRWSFEVESRK
jgi:hypothetical protein